MHDDIVRGTTDIDDSLRATPDSTGPAGATVPADTAGGLQVRHGAKALVRNDGRVLLVRERREDDSTFWTLPGGGVEPGESYRKCLKREFREELGCRVAVESPISACLYQHTTLRDTVTLYSVFEATPMGAPRPNRAEGVVDCGWRQPATPPSDTLDPFQRLLHRLPDGD